MNFCVVGAGAWGTAFAVHLAKLGHPVVLVPRRREQASQLEAARENTEYLPKVAFPSLLRIGADLARALSGAETIIVASPSQAVRETCERMRSALGTAPARPRLIISLTKGLELKTHLRPSQVIGESLPGYPVAVLAGPTNAGEVARGLPAAMVLASSDSDHGLSAAQSAMSGSSLRIYTSDDPVGVEIGGCLKNIYAIAAGCCVGLRLGDNARAALVTRALAEMVRVGAALGAQQDTFCGLSGAGDLIATCNGEWSRNREFGRQIGEGRSVEELTSNRKTVVEGHITTRSFEGLCAERKIDAPILREVYAILYAGKKPAAALTALMTRELKREAALSTSGD